MSSLIAYEDQLDHMADARGVSFFQAVDRAGVSRSTIYRCQQGQQRMTFKVAERIRQAIEAIAHEQSVERGQDGLRQPPHGAVQAGSGA